MSLGKTLIASFALTLISSAVFATEVPCPAVEIIPQVAFKINKADKIGDNLYTTYSSNVAFRESKLPWYVSAQEVHAINPTNAIKEGQILLIKASVKKVELAQRMGNYYYCYYGNGNIVASSGFVK